MSRIAPYVTGRASQRLLGIYVLLVAMCAAATAPAVFAQDSETPRFKRISMQYIAALGQPEASEGNDAQRWGLWREDPGPRGVWLQHFDQLQADGGVAPADWIFDANDWWLEENGMIMEQPEFPLPAGRYLVTGGRKTTVILTVDAANAQGSMHWSLDKKATIQDVTHLGCRSARYTPLLDQADFCSPANAPQEAFRVAPGAAMPVVSGCGKQDYAVLFVVGVAVETK